MKFPSVEFLFLGKILVCKSNIHSSLVVISGQKCSALIVTCCLLGLLGVSKSSFIIQRALGIVFCCRRAVMCAQEQEKVLLQKTPEGWRIKERWSIATTVNGWMDAMSNVTPSGGQTREKHKALTQSGPKNSQPIVSELILALLKWFVYLKSVSFEPVSQNFQLPCCGPNEEWPLKTELYYFSQKRK